jgi:hypothetical protein
VKSEWRNGEPTEALGEALVELVFNADVRDRLGYYGPTYISAKAATIAPSYFVRGLPTNAEEAARTRTSTKINAVLDLITLRMRRDELNDVPIEKKAKFVVHCDSREIEPIFLYVRNLSPSLKTADIHRSSQLEDSRPGCLTGLAPMQNDDGLK